MRKIIMAAFLLAAIFSVAKAETEEAMADTSRVYNLDEVVVAPRIKDFRSLRMQPVSSNIMTGKEMNSLGVRDLRDIANYVPAFVMPDYGARFTSSIEKSPSGPIITVISSGLSGCCRVLKKSDRSTSS